MSTPRKKKKIDKESFYVDNIKVTLVTYVRLNTFSNV